MLKLSSRLFLRYLTLAFIAAIFLDILLNTLGVERELGYTISYIVFSLSLVVLLYARLRCTKADNRLSFLGLLGPIGFLFGIYVYQKYD